MPAGTVAIRIIGDNSSFKNTVDDTDKAVGGLGSTIGKIGAVVGGAFAVDKIFSFGKAAIDQATESNKIAAQTEAAIKSTGGAAKVTAGQVGDLATAISNKTGIDDEAIQKGQNLLLTFTNIGNKAGKNNDIFNQASKIMVDMGAAMGTDASGSAIQLGKALNDPIKGITALTRVGVTFTEQQKDQIKTLVASGDLVGAQKVILGELNKEFGGSAEAQATAGDKLKVVWGNLQEQLGNQLLPVFNNVANFLMDNLPGAMATLGRVLQPVIAFTQDLLAKGKEIVDVFKLWRSGGIDLAGAIAGLISDDLRFLPTVQKIIDVVKELASWIGDHLKPILISLGIGLALLISPIGTLVAAIVYAYAKFETFRDVVNAVVTFLTDTVAPAVATVASYLIGQFSNLVDWVQQYWPQISEAIGHVLAVIQGYIQFYTDIISAIWRQWGDDLLRMVRTVFDFVRGSVENALQLVRGIILTVTALINGDWGKAWDGFKQILAAIWDQIFNIVRTSIDLIKSILGGAASTFGDVARAAFGKIMDAASGAAGWVRDRVDDIVRFILGIPGRIANVGRDILNKLIPDVPGGGVVRDVLGAVHIPGFAQGGVVPGATGAPMLAMVHGGETITPPGAGGGTTTVVFNVNGYLGPGAEAALADTVHNALLAKQRVGGPLGFEVN